MQKGLSMFYDFTDKKGGDRALRPKPEGRINKNKKAEYKIPLGQNLRPKINIKPNLPNISCIAIML